MLKVYFVLTDYKRLDLEATYVIELAMVSSSDAAKKIGVMRAVVLKTFLPRG